MAIALGPTRAIGGPRDPLGYQQITSIASATGLTVPGGAFYAFIVPEGTGAICRWRDDGTNPTSTVGMPLTSGTPFAYAGNLSAVKFIDSVGTTTLNISYYR